MVTKSQKASAIIAAIGNFDGVHRGHQFLLERTKDISAPIGAVLAAIVFDPHPRRYFQPDTPPFLITSPDQRDALIKKMGIEKVFRVPFDHALASLSPEAFVETVILKNLGLSGVVTGEEFRFGAQRAGDASLLGRLCQARGIVAHAISPKLSRQHGAEKIGSSGVRQAIVEGDMASVRHLLDRPWEVTGIVVEGQKLGRTLGFATANLTLGDFVAPRHGVYAVMVRVGGTTHHGVANYGRRPTVGADVPILEVHVFDFDADLYGKQIAVSFIEFIRDEKKFDSLEALKKQIADDSNRARNLLTDQSSKK